MHEADRDAESAHIRQADDAVADQRRDDPDRDQRCDVPRVDRTRRGGLGGDDRRLGRRREQYLTRAIRPCAAAVRRSLRPGPTPHSEGRLHDPVPTRVGARPQAQTQISDRWALLPAAPGRRPTRRRNYRTWPRPGPACRIAHRTCRCSPRPWRPRPSANAKSCARTAMYSTARRVATGQGISGAYRDTQRRTTAIRCRRRWPCRTTPAHC